MKTQKILQLGLLLSAGCAMAGMGAGLAAGASVTYTDSFSSNGSNGGYTLGFNQFNTSLGTLTSVDLSMGTNYTISGITLQNNTNTAFPPGFSETLSENFVVFPYHNSVYLGSPYGTALVSGASPYATIASTGSYTLAAGTSTAAADVSNLVGVAGAVGSSQLNSFEGTGTVNLGIDPSGLGVIGSSNVTSTVPTGDESSVVASFNASGSGTLQVTYNYTSAAPAGAAPLPAAVWPGLLTLVGMAVAGGLKMRRRSV